MTWGWVPLPRAKEDRVDWLYSGPGTVNREEYLLGKRIDKLVDPTLVEEEREQQVGRTHPPSPCLIGVSLL